MSNVSPPPRVRTSSIARTPAMPLPTTTSFGAISDLHQAEVADHGSGAARRCGEEEFEHRVPQEVFDHPQRHVCGTAGRNGEVAHGFSVAKEHHGHHVIAGIAAAEVHRLGYTPGGHH